VRLLREKQIFAVPTLTIFEHFANHTEAPEKAALNREIFDLKVQDFRKQVAAGVPMALGSDVGPFPHGTQAREFVLMGKYGMSPLAVPEADLINGAKLLGWEGKSMCSSRVISPTSSLEPPDPLEDLGTLQNVSFV
jgi:imidazolonepropionase-like amidohydrolase